MKQKPYIALLMVCTMFLSGCSHKKNDSLPVAVQKAADVYQQTYVYNDKGQCKKPVTFHVLRLETKRTYVAQADVERIHLIEVAKKYAKDLGIQKRMGAKAYSIDPLEYIYELTDHLLYMPVYFVSIEAANTRVGQLYNLVILEKENTFELIGQADRALLNIEQYPRMYRFS